MPRPKAPTPPPAPMAYRPKTPEERTLAQLVAKHQGVTISTLIAQVMRGYMHDYLDEIGGLETLLAEIEKAEAQEAQLAARQVEALMRQVSVASSTADRDTSSSATP